MRNGGHLALQRLVSIMVFVALFVHRGNAQEHQAEHRKDQRLDQSYKQLQCNKRK